MPACPGCQATAPDGARFCARCGTQLPEDCTSCQAPLLPEARFCHSCGQPVHPNGGQPATPGAVPTGRAHLADQPPGASGENRVATILFVDMVSSVEATARMAAEDTAALVNRLLEVMVEAVRRYGGRVDRLLGDGILGVFGAPVVHEDDPRRAALAALEIRDAADRLGFQVSSGINTGEVYFGTMGSQAHSEFTVMGPAVNLAARLQGAAPGGRVLVGATTARSLQAGFELVPTRLDIKGLEGPVEAFELREPSGEHAEDPDPEGLPMVGRATELARLEELVLQAAAGRGTGVALIAEAGVGKSRLIAALRTKALAASAPPLWLEGRAFELTSETAYGPVLDLLRAHLGLGAQSPAGTQAEELEKAVADLCSAGALSTTAATDITALLANLLDLPLPGEDPLAEASPESIRNRTFLALRDLILALARTRPLVLVLEDLHWADPLTLALIPVLMEAIEGAPVLLLVTYRPVRDGPTENLPLQVRSKAPGRWIELPLSELSADEARALVQHAAGRELPGEVVSLVLDKSDGNPFFLREVVRSLEEAGLLAGASGEAEVDGLVLPATLRSVLLSRIDRLDPEPREVLRCAAVLGRVFRPAVVAEMTPAVPVAALLAELQAHGLVYRERLVPEEAWSFRHALSQEAVYRSMLRPERERLHGEAARALQQEAGAGAQRIEELAYHFDRSDDPVQAAIHLVRAGTKAARAYDNATAIGHLERALARADEAGPGELPAGVLLTALETLGDVRALAGQPGQGVTCFREALAHQDAQDPIVRARLLRKLAMALFQDRAWEEADERLDEADEVLTDRLEDPEAIGTWIETQVDRAWFHYWRSQADKLEATIARAGPLVERFGSPAQRARFRFSHIFHALRVGRYVVDHDLLEAYDEMLEAAREAVDPTHEALATFGTGFGYLFHGDLDTAEPLLLEGLAMARRIGDKFNEIRSLTYLAILHRARGQVDEARRRAAQVRPMAAGNAMTEYVGAADANLAWAAWRTGDHEEAHTLATQALEALQAPVPAYPFRWLACSVLLSLAVADGDVTAASHAAGSMLREDQQGLPEPLTLALGKGQALAEAEDLAGALAAFSEALEHHKALGHL